MRNVHACGPAPLSGFQKAVQSVHERQRLAAAVNKMVREIERLKEDNTQLRAAIALYREVERRSTACSAAGS